MSENLRLYHACLYAMNAVVDRVDDARWDEPSTCTEWSCRQVLGHCIWHTEALAAAVGGGDPPEPRPEAEVAGADPRAAWRDARDRVLVGLDRQGVLQREVPGPFGSMAVDDRLRIQASDLFSHTWDIAAALGVEPGLDPDVATALLPGLQAAGDLLRRPGLLGPEVELPEPAGPVETYLAYAGRDPR